MTDDLTRRPWYGRLEVVAPVMMVVFGVLDIALRFMPIERLAFRAWETVTYHPEPNAPFAALKVYRNSHSYGDLSNSGNLPSLREYHAEVFTTDEYGFRNPPQTQDARVPSGLLVGTSFSAGCGLSDDETLSARLSARSECRVYNAAGPTDYCNCARRVASRLNMCQGTVIYEFAERTWYPQDYLDCLDAQHVNYPTPHSVRAEYFHRHPAHQPMSWDERWDAWWQAWIESVRDHIPKSHLEIIGVKMYKLLQNDRILPNAPARANVTSRVLRNGDVMLFPADQPRQLLGPKNTVWIPFYCNWFANEMRKDNLDLIVVLVPEKFTVYRPFFSTPETAQDISPEYLDQVERALKRAGIRVVNLLPVFRQAAIEGLANHRYIYRRDDTHWNPGGVQIAADCIPFTCASPPSQQ
jgi:hypothetical protein